MLAPLTAANLSALSGIRHGFFTRRGGVSKGLYEGLNCGLGSSDEPALVIENRRRVASYLGGNPETVVTLYQIHGATALTVDTPLARDSLPKADAVVSKTPGLVVGVLTADCAPLLLADHKARIVAAAHAGWRGAVAGIVESTISEMERQGAKRNRIVAALGPCISQPAYEVGEDFQRAMTEQAQTNRQFFVYPAPGAKPHFNLAGYVLHRLAAAGIQNIVNATQCTHAGESLFYSFRRTTQRKEADYGRQISAIVVT